MAFDEAAERKKLEALKVPPGKIDLLIGRRKARAAPEGSKTFKWDNLAKEVAKSGKNCINLTVGQPNTKVPKGILKALAEQSLVDKHGYVQHHGIDKLKDEIRRHINETNTFGFRVEDNSQLIVGPAKALVFLAIKAAVPKAGDTLLVPDPAWVSYAPMADSLHLKVRSLPLNSETYLPDKGFYGALSANKGAQALLLNSPSNPVGNVFSGEMLERISEEYDNPHGTIISDEVYHELVFDGKHRSIAEFVPERTVVIDSFSKSHSVPGFRVGFAVSQDPYIIKDMVNLNSNLMGGTSGAIQAAMVQAFTSDTLTEVKGMVSEYRKRRDVICNSLLFLNTLGTKYAVKIPYPAGAFYIFPKFYLNGKPLDRKQSEEFAEKLGREFGVATVPGHEFGEIGTGCLRLSYGSAGPDELKDAARRIGLLLLSNSGMKAELDAGKIDQYLSKPDPEVEAANLVRP